MIFQRAKAMVEWDIFREMGLKIGFDLMRFCDKRCQYSCQPTQMYRDFRAFIFSFSFHSHFIRPDDERRHCCRQIQKAQKKKKNFVLHESNRTK